MTGIESRMRSQYLQLRDRTLLELRRSQIRQIEEFTRGDLNRRKITSAIGISIEPDAKTPNRNVVSTPFALTAHFFIANHAMQISRTNRCQLSVLVVHCPIDGKTQS